MDLHGLQVLTVFCCSALTLPLALFRASQSPILCACMPLIRCYEATKSIGEPGTQYYDTWFDILKAAAALCPST
jgi:hypothetical protein